MEEADVRSLERRASWKGLALQSFLDVVAALNEFLAAQGAAQGDGAPTPGRRGTRVRPAFLTPFGLVEGDPEPTPSDNAGPLNDAEGRSLPGQVTELIYQRRLEILRQMEAAEGTQELLDVTGMIPLRNVRIIPFAGEAPFHFRELILFDDQVAGMTLTYD
ncbi:MAG: hypothetical protein IRY95_08135 [Clostridia bacterium]|nr:hypothetical protein [Clostridia bacterium]